MASLVRGVRLYSYLAGVSLKSKMAYRHDFIFGFIAGISSDLAGLLFIGIVFSNLPEVRGWTGWQVATIFALNSLCFGLANTLFNGIWWINGRAYSGELNHFLVRPSNPLLTLVASKTAIHDSGKIFTSVAIFAIASHQAEVDWGVPLALLTAALVLGGTIIWTSVMLATSSLGFWTITQGTSLVFSVLQVGDLARYPVTIYPFWIQALISWIVPFSFASFVPATIILDHGFPPWGWALPLMVVACPVIAYQVWLAGLRRYEGPGT